MRGKIALEEHWAIEGTLEGNNMGPPMPSAWRDRVRRGLLDVHGERLADMDRTGIEFAILSLNAPGIQTVTDVGRAVDMARQSNDLLAGEIAREPARFAGFAALPMQDPDAAVRELTRCVKDLGFVGAMVNGFTQRNTPETVVYYDIAEYRPFWAAVHEMGVPFYLHPRLTIPSRAQAYEGHPWLYAPAWDFAAQTSIHALRLICSGLFDEFPRLQLVLGHLGERIPFDLWRIDNMMKKVPSRIPAKKAVGDYFRENVHLTTSGQFHDPTLHCAMAEVGADRIMFSVDFPFEEMDAGAKWFDNAAISAADRLKIGRTNAIRLFKLPLK